MDSRCPELGAERQRLLWVTGEDFMQAMHSGKPECPEHLILLSLAKDGDDGKKKTLCLSLKIKL